MLPLSTPFVHAYEFSSVLLSVGIVVFSLVENICKYLLVYWIALSLHYELYKNIHIILNI